jgi:glycosyltransferase involved in cell wall biosynthesis
VHGWTLPRPDVLVATSPQFFCGWAGVFQKWIFRVRAPFAQRVPLVVEIRDIWPESIGAVDAINNRFVLAVLQWMERVMYRQADHIVTVGNGYRRRLLERGVSEEKISVVMNGVDHEVLDPQRTDAVDVRGRHRLGDRFVCSFLGTVGMASGLDVLVRTARRLKDEGDDSIRLLVVGDGARREELESQAQSENLDALIFAGRKPKGEMAAYLAASDVCLVLLRKSELFTTVIPSKIFEAAGARRPIIIGVDGEARRLVEAAGAGLFCQPEDEFDLLRRVRELQAQPDLCRQLGNSGREYVVAHFDRDRLAAQYIQILESCCVSGGPTVDLGTTSPGSRRRTAPASATK